MNPAVQAVTRAMIDAVLERVERGLTTVADANALRAYLLMLEGQLRALMLEQDDDEKAEQLDDVWRD